MNPKTAAMSSLHRLFVVSAAAVALLVSACAHHEGASEWKDIEDARWTYGDTLVFNAARTDSVPANLFVMTIRHTDGYEYANVWLEMAYLNADSLVADTFNIALADEFGHWLGSGNGVTFQYTDTLKPSRKVDLASPLRLRHIMRVDTLTEIERIGLTY